VKPSFRNAGGLVDLGFREPKPQNSQEPSVSQDSFVSGPDNIQSIQNRRRQRHGSSPEEEDPCPYYYDAKFQLKMYRGPGFRNFHPVLGSMEGHREVSDEWDARQLRREKHSRQSHISFLPRNSTSEYLPTRTDVPATTMDNQPLTCQSTQIFDPEQEQDCLGQVLLVFPQIEHHFVRELFRERHPGHLGGSHADCNAAGAKLPGVIISEIAEMESFPKQKHSKQMDSATPRDNDDITIKWNREILKNETYYKEALILLADEFTRVPTHFINRTLREKKNLYETFDLLADKEKTYNNTPRKPYNRSRLGRVALEKKYQRTAAEPRDGHQYISIVNEFQAAKQQQYREEARQKRKEADEKSEEENFRLHQLQGSLVDCQCCFDETPINRVVNCEGEETHFFCNRCINIRAKEQIGAMKYEMMCMDTSDCGAALSRETLAQALPIKICDKLAEIQQLAEIKAAGLDGLEQCPFCEFQAVCAPVEVDIIFECLNPGCEKVSCRKCREESHLPRSCEEIKKDKGLSARHTVEEARSEAMIRVCPRCKVKIVKSDGCNKMTCSNCRAIMCYVCKKDITGQNYEHFGAGGARCPLQDQYADDRHQQEADEAETAAIAAAKARDANVNEEELRIEAHLNLRPGRERALGARRDLYGQPNVIPNAYLPGFPLMDLGPRLEVQGRLPGAAPNMPVMERVRANIEEARREQERVRGGLVREHQRLLAEQLQALPPPRLDRAGVQLPVPPVRHAHQYLERAYPERFVNPGPAQPAAANLAGNINGDLAQRLQHLHNVVNLIQGANHRVNLGLAPPAQNHPLNPGNGPENPPLWLQIDHLGNYRDIQPVQVLQPQNGVQGNMPNQRNR
jgi:IBR domain, a half RING-finger domain